MPLTFRRKLNIPNNISFGNEIEINGIPLDKAVLVTELFNDVAALYDEDRIESELVYDKEVIIDSLAPSEGRGIFMKLTDKPIQDFYLTANDYRFKIIIE